MSPAGGLWAAGSPACVPRGEGHRRRGALLALPGPHSPASWPMVAFPVTLEPCVGCRLGARTPGRGRGPFLPHGLQREPSEAQSSAHRCRDPGRAGCLGSGGQSRVRCAVPGTPAGPSARSGPDARPWPAPPRSLVGEAAAFGALVPARASSCGVGGLTVSSAAASPGRPKLCRASSGFCPGLLGACLACLQRAKAWGAGIGQFRPCWLLKPLISVLDASAHRPFDDLPQTPRSGFNDLKCICPQNPSLSLQPALGPRQVRRNLGRSFLLGE